MDMSKQETFTDVPHYEWIKENEQISIPSIFEFKNGTKELFPFLYACKKKKCTVYFKNEDMLVKCDADNVSEMNQSLLMSLYMTLLESPKIFNDYIRYITKKSFENATV